jgi:DNA primase
VADERDLIRSRIDIVDLIGQRVRLKKSGRNWTGLCPFHEDRNPSFSVSADIGRYKCWSCGASGDAFTWVMQTQGVEFREALEILAKQTGVELSQGKGPDRSQRQRMFDAMSAAQAFFRQQLQTNEGARAYCDRRGLTADVLDEWEIGYSGDYEFALGTELQRQGFKLSECKDLFLVDGDDKAGYIDRFKSRLMFPIRDDQGHLIAFGGRVTGDAIPKYINSSDTPLFSKGRTLYGMNKAKDPVRKSRQAVLVEGYLDVIACHRAGVTNAVATLGTAMSEQHVKRLALWCDEVVVLYDSDEAGQKAAERAVELLTVGGLKARVALMPKGEDPDTLLRSKGPEAVRVAVTKGVEPIDFLIQQIGLRFSPNQDEYWQEATAALAKLDNQLEVERHLMPLASRYPFMRDPERAARTLRGMVRQAKRKPSQVKDKPEQQKKTVVTPLPPQLEAAPFRALADEATRAQAWEICKNEELFVTEAGRRLSRALLESWVELPSDPSPSSLLQTVPDERDRDLLAAVFMLEGPELTEAALADVQDRLSRRRDEILLRTAAVQGERSDADLLRIDARLKELKGEKPLEKPWTEELDSDTDPFV